MCPADNIRLPDPVLDIITPDPVDVYPSPSWQCLREFLRGIHFFTLTNLVILTKEPTGGVFLSIFSLVKRLVGLIQLTQHVQRKHTIRVEIEYKKKCNLILITITKKEIYFKGKKS